MPPKECPEGKVINPKTGRCVNQKVEKKCPEGKVRNPKTGRCIQNKQKVPVKEKSPKVQIFTLKVNGNDITFESHYKNTYAFDKLSELVSSRQLKTSFAKDLVTKGPPFSEKQWAWVHKLVLDAEAQKPKPKSASPKNRYTVTIKGETFTFESKHTHKEAFKILSDLIATGKVFSKFAIDLVTNGLEKLTKTQIAWVHKIVMDNETQKPIERLAVPKIRALLHKAGEKLMAPTITFVKKDLELRIKLLAKDHNRYPRQIYMTGLGDTYYGRIDDRGYVIGGKDLTKDITDVLRELEGDPQKYAAEYGKLTGRCCFCRSKLTTDPSLRMGYGETCAKNYRLPYKK
jgi:hypothetical protein